MVNLSADGVENKVGSKYSLVIAVAKRAKQIREGSPIMVDSESTNPIVIAMEEIAAGKVNVIVPTTEQVEAAERERRGLGPIEKPKAPAVSELLRIEPEEDEAEVAEILGIEELEEDEEEEEEEEEKSLEDLLASPEDLEEETEEE
jgi:DNA-directed RNA polymerase subunit omega